MKYENIKERYLQTLGSDENGTLDENLFYDFWIEYQKELI